MLDIIRSSVRYEISKLCNIGIADVISSVSDSGKFMSTYASREKMINTNLEKFFGGFVE